MNTVDKVLYTGKTRTTGGREGSAQSDDLALDIKLSPPGSGRAGTNPEQLFAAGWSACFIGAMAIAAGKHKIAFPKDTTVDAEIDLGLAGDGYLLQARLTVTLPGLEREVAQEIVSQAHATCPYSKATRGNINVDLRLA